MDENSKLITDKEAFDWFCNKVFTTSKRVQEIVIIDDDMEPCEAHDDFSELAGMVDYCSYQPLMSGNLVTRLGWAEFLPVSRKDYTNA